MMSRGSLRRLLVGLVFALSSAALAPVVSSEPVVSATSASDIPGVPMPGPVATGSLGGPIYDVVFQLFVPPGSVIVASLSGSAGTDFDLYLFDSTATTVVSNAGLLVRSAGPTSTESISWGTRFGGTFYVDLNGATNVLGTYMLAVQVLPDTIPPSVSMVLGTGKPANQSVVPVSLNVVDPLAAPAEMAFSTDGTAFLAWAPYAASSAWTFPPGDGTHELWVKVRNTVGLESVPARATVMIDTTAPSAVEVAPDSGARVGGLRPSFAVTFDEPMDPATWDRLGLVVQEASGPLVAGSYAYDLSTFKGTFVPAADMIPGNLYIVTIGGVTDLAGNTVAPRGSWTITVLEPSSLKVWAAPAVVGVGGRSVVSVILAAPTGVLSLDVLARAAGDSGFVPFTSVPLDGGRATLAVLPLANTTYRFSYGGSATVAPAVADVRVLVRRSVALAGPGASVARGARVGRSVQLVASIGPRAASVPVTFTLRRWDAGRKAWVVASRRSGHTDSAGRVSTAWKPASAGSWSWRVAAAPTADYANNLSGVYRFTVTR